MDNTFKITRSILAVLMVLLLDWHLCSAQNIPLAADTAPSFKGAFLAISDADMIATAYGSGMSNKINGIEDSLMYIRSVNGLPQIQSRIHATNSVISWPAILAWHPTKPYAYVAETRGRITPDTPKMKNVFYAYPKGMKVSIIDYSLPNHPSIIQEQMVGENLQNVSLNQRGDLLVAGTTEKDKEMMVASVKDGLIDQICYFSDPEVDRTDTRDGGFRSIEFHPQKDVVAVNLNGTSVAFFNIIKEGRTIRIARIGKSLKVAKKLSVGNWHPSGKYFLVSNVNWGKGNLGAVFNKKGELISVGFDEDGQHEVVSKVKVGLSPEGFDVSPNGEYAIVVNMRRTYVPSAFWFVPARKTPTLSLIKINQKTGQLTHLGKPYGFEGVLPEDAIFDESGKSIAVAVYHEKNEGYPTKGWIDFWEVRNDQLLWTKHKLYVTRGVHNLLRVP
ncbi:MAG: hypothetical protein AAF206_16485 [Bacteroidota bacterium]